MARALPHDVPPAAAADAGTLAPLLTAIALVGCLGLQRLAVPIGEFRLPVATPILVGVVATGLATGAMTIVPRRLVWLIGFAAWALAATAIAGELMRRAGLRASLPSLGHLLLLCGLFVVRFAEPQRAAATRSTVQTALLLVAVAGIAQFAAQFAGWAVFSFDGILPPALSIEPLYNGVIPVGGTGLFKSNGFFLVEPSVFSQLMAIAIAVELLHARRPVHLLAFAAGLVLAVSGTGWLVLVAFLAVALLQPSRLRLRGILALALVVGATAVLAFVLLDEVGLALLARWDEVGEERSSGHLRFVAPFLALARIAELHPGFLATGLGPGAGEDIDLGFAYSVHAPGKILIEFGLPGLVLWLGLVLSSCRRPGEAALLVPALTMLFFGGGYQQFAPIIGLVLLLLAWPPRDDPAARARD
ncbi:MAG: hypothetical protein JNK67_26275 [Alphaproteobacteria bacterium]|nr:hypothetical protein [Alphaproteobacteria bacterium]